jgi:uncharacterized protein (DUF58 family)
MKVKNIVIHILKSLKVLLAYAVCVLIGLAYTLYVDGSSGVLLLSFMFLIPVMSIVCMMVSSRNVDVKVKLSNDTVKKNSPVDVTLELTKSNAMPVPFLNVTLGYSPHVNTTVNETYSKENFPKLRFSMAFERSRTYDYALIAKVSGKGSVYVEDVYIYDYLGLFRVKLKSIDSVANVYVTPEVRDVKSSQELFNSICNDVVTNDEEEESHEDAISVGSTLGYLHREYVMGDSPRRINWKLSCKKDKLMVRLDEPSPQTKPCFLFDMAMSPENPDTLSNLLNFEHLVESTLSLLGMCVRFGIECECMLCNCGQYIKRSVVSVDDLYSLAVTISHSEWNGSHTLPVEVANLKTSDSMYILCTDLYDTAIQTQIANLKDRNVSVNVVLSPQYKGKVSETNVWIVDKDLSITQSGF